MTECEKQRRDAQQASYTVKEWCNRRRVSRAMFYVLDAKGLTPRSHYAGAKRLISDEADAEWLAAREAEANTAAA
jgi:hypothetical protein